MSGKAYIGVKPCGCVTFAQVVGVESRSAEKRELAKVIRSGRRIEVVSAEEARERLTFDCQHGTMPADPQAAAADAVATARGGDRG